MSLARTVMFKNYNTFFRLFSQKLQEDDFTLLTERNFGRNISNRSLPSLLAGRELGCSGICRNFSSGQKSQISDRFLPNERQVLGRYRQKVFCGSYSDDGNLFLTSCQGKTKSDFVSFQFTLT